jgi:hypothetical protein
LKTIRIPKNLMYLSNRLPMANYDFRGKKNQTVKMSRSINGKNRQSGFLQDAVSRIQRISIDGATEPDNKLPSLPV